MGIQVYSFDVSCFAKKENKDNSVLATARGTKFTWEYTYCNSGRKGLT